MPQATVVAAVNGVVAECLRSGLWCEQLVEEDVVGPVYGSKSVGRGRCRTRVYGSEQVVRGGCRTLGLWFEQVVGEDVTPWVYGLNQ